MSIEAIIWALDFPDITPTDKLILFCVAENQCDDLGTAIFDINRIAERVNVSIEQVEATLDRFTEAGYFTIPTDHATLRFIRGKKEGYRCYRFTELYETAD